VASDPPTILTSGKDERFGGEAGPTPQAIFCCLESGEVAVTFSTSEKLLAGL
jgi:hypothetical protein